MTSSGSFSGGDPAVRHGATGVAMTVDEALAALPRVLDALTGAEWWRQSDAQVAATIQACHRAESQIVATQVEAVGEGLRRGLPVAAGCRSGAAWLRSLVPLTPRSGPVTCRPAQPASSCARWPRSTSSPSRRRTRGGPADPPGGPGPAARRGHPARPEPAGEGRGAGAAPAGPPGGRSAGPGRGRAVGRARRLAGPGDLGPVEHARGAGARGRSDGPVGPRRLHGTAARGRRHPRPAERTPAHRRRPHDAGRALPRRSRGGAGCPAPPGRLADPGAADRRRADPAGRRHVGHRRRGHAPGGGGDR